MEIGLLFTIMGTLLTVVFGLFTVYTLKLFKND